MRLRKFYDEAQQPNQTQLEAWQTLDHLLEDNAMGFETEPDGLNDTWLKLSKAHNSSPKIWMDAYSAVFGICGGMRLVTLDKDFKNFEPMGLDVLLLRV